jgi:glutamate:GABA antiporter
VSEDAVSPAKTGMAPQKVLGIFALAMINVAAVLIIRNFPSMAEFG